MKIGKLIALLIAVLMMSAIIPCAAAAGSVEILPAQVISDAETDTGLVVVKLPANPCWKDTCYFVKTDDSGVAFINVMVRFPEYQAALEGSDKDLGITIARVVIAQDSSAELDEIAAEEASVRLQNVYFLNSTREITLPNGAKAYVTPNPTFGHVFNADTGTFEKIIPEGICTNVKALRSQLKEFVSNIVCLDEYKAMLTGDGASQAELDGVLAELDGIVTDRKLSLDLGTNTIINIPTDSDESFWKNEANEYWRSNGDAYWDANIRDFRSNDDNSHWQPGDVPFWAPECDGWATCYDGWAPEY